MEGRYKFLSARTNPTVKRRLEDGRNVEMKISAETAISLKGKTSDNNN